MSIPALGTSHLQQTKLSQKPADLLEHFATWLSTVEFARHVEEMEILRHPQLHEKIKPLLTELGLLNKGYSVVKIPGPKSAPVYDSEGSAYIVPIQILEASQPTVSEHPLVPGEVTYIKSGVKVSPKLILLFVVD